MATFTGRHLTVSASNTFRAGKRATWLACQGLTHWNRTFLARSSRYQAQGVCISSHCTLWGERSEDTLKCLPHHSEGLFEVAAEWQQGLVALPAQSVCLAAFLAAHLWKQERGAVFPSLHFFTCVWLCCALGNTALDLAAFEFGFRGGSVPATKLIVVSALSGYGPGGARAVLLGAVFGWPCGRGWPTSEWHADCLLSLRFLGLAACLGGCCLARPVGIHLAARPCAWLLHLLWFGQLPLAFVFSVEHELYIFAVGSRSPFLSSHVWSAMTGKVAACQMLYFVLHLWI